jgi:hypothetical protein
MTLKDFLDLHLIDPMYYREILRLIRQQWPQFHETTIIESRSHIVGQIAVKGELVEERFTNYPKAGFKAYLWRLAGTLFNQYEWYMKGAFIKESGRHYTVRNLKAYDMGIRMPHVHTTHNSVIMQLRGAYDPMTDVLYLMRNIYDEKVI